MALLLRSGKLLGCPRAVRAPEPLLTTATVGQSCPRAAIWPPQNEPTYRKTYLYRIHVLPSPFYVKRTQSSQGSSLGFSEACTPSQGTLPKASARQLPSHSPHSYSAFPPAGLKQLQVHSTTFPSKPRGCHCPIPAPTALRNREGAEQPSAPNTQHHHSTTTLQHRLETGIKHLGEET